jgi:hypothetical protein
MANFEQMSRVLFNHVWDDARQWASALEHLADLNDMEIAVLAASDWPHGSAESNRRELHPAEMQDGN